MTKTGRDLSDINAFSRPRYQTERNRKSREILRDLDREMKDFI